MKPWIRNILILFVVGILAAVLVYLYTFRKTELSVASKKADIEIAAGELIRSFEADEAAANTLYLGKIIRVTGVVESVSEDSVGISIYLQDPDAMAGVICSFDKKTNDISWVEKGTTVAIKGICTGYLMDVVFNRCSLDTKKP
jgi:hypothetical protein